MTGRFDPRTWIVWGAAMSVTPMLGRNPFPLATVLIVAIAVRMYLQTERDAHWRRFIKLAALFASVSVIFNVVTYHGGDRVLVSVPEWLPIIGGAITLNAVVFGLLNGLAIIALVLVWTTVATHVEWNALIRLAPPGLSGIAVSSSIAVTLVPKTIESFTEIRDVQAIRGFPLKRPRDLVPLVTPLLTLGLERSVTLSEALESRGFGGPERERGAGRSNAIAIVGGLTALSLAAFLVATGRELPGLGAFVIAAMCAWLAIRFAKDDSEWRPTRYRPVSLTRQDGIVLSVSIVSMISTLIINRFERAAFLYEPYPAIDLPIVSVPAMLAIGAMLVPIMISSSTSDRGV